MIIDTAQTKTERKIAHQERINQIASGFTCAIFFGGFGPDWIRIQSGERLIWPQNNEKRHR